VRAGELGLGPLRPVRDGALGDDYPAARRSCDELELGLPVDGERRQVPRVHADDLGVEGDRALELLGVMRLHERVEAELARDPQELCGRRVVQVAE
jgi:hypothetical protein